MQSSDALVPKYRELVYNGFWFSPEREALQALITETQRDVTGLVRLKPYKGNIIGADRKARKAFTIQKLQRWTATFRNLTRATRPVSSA